MDLAGIDFVPQVSRRRLDAGTVPQLRTAHRRLWRMPLPGISTRWRCGCDRSGVFAGPIAFDRRISGARGEHPSRWRASRTCFLVCAVAETERGALELSHQSRVTARYKPVSATGSLPANSDGDRAQVSRSTVALAVQIAKLGVEIHVGANLAGNAAAEVFSELILAGG